jgi:hypothetical protein
LIFLLTAGSTAVALSGCASLVAIPLNIAAAGVIGSAADDYKADHAPRATFGDEPVDPLPYVPQGAHVAVWPGYPEGDEVENAFADRIGSRFSVLTPGAVTAIIKGAHLDADLTNITNVELTPRFATVCKKTHSELLFAGRAAARLSFDALAFDCKSQRVVWDERLSITGTVTRANQDQVTQLAGEAWAKRVLDAEQLAAARALN